MLGGGGGGWGADQRRHLSHMNVMFNDGLVNESFFVDFGWNFVIRNLILKKGFYFMPDTRKHANIPYKYIYCLLMLSCRYMCSIVILSDDYLFIYDEIAIRLHFRAHKMVMKWVPGSILHWVRTQEHKFLRNRFIRHTWAETRFLTNQPWHWVPCHGIIYRS